VTSRGEYDFEALEAHRPAACLQDHLRRLLAGDSVKLARYDFITGKSHPEGARRCSCSRATCCCSKASTG
jgi:uridine kinase